MKNIFLHKITSQLDILKQKNVRKSVSSLFAALLAMCMIGLPFSQAFAAAYITLNSFSGNATTLQVTGGGWNGGENVAIYLSNISGSPAAHTVVQSDGSLGPVDVLIPFNTPQGALSIIAVGSSGQSQTNSYYVTPFTPQITVPDGLNTPGSSVSVSGNGFAPGETVVFSIQGGTVGSATANASGSFSGASFTVPNMPSQTYQLHATGSSSGADAIFYFYIGGFFPSASPSSYYLLPGENLSFSGSGFASGESITVTEENSSSTLSTITADSSGSFASAGSFAIPLSLGGGVRTFHITGNKGNTAADIMVTIGLFNGQISPSTYFISPGNALTFSGNGFAPGETVHVTVSGSTTPVAIFTAGSDGTFTGAGNIVIPFSFAGMTKTFTVRGLSSNTTASVDITVGGFFSSISPSDYFVTPGQAFTISGNGFAAGEDITLTMNGANTKHVTASSSGGFVNGGPFTAPVTGGPLHIIAAGSLSGSTASVDVTLGGLFPSVSPNQWYVLPGSVLTFAGSGFAPNELVAISNGAASFGSVAASSTGEFITSSSTVPFAAAGPKVYTFTGADSGAVATVTITLAGLAPYADADTYYITPGSVVHVGGHGFAGNEGISISVGNTTMHAIADTFGDVPPTAITIPFTSTNSAVVSLRGDMSGVSANVPIALAPFYPQVTPDTWYTAPGSTVHFSGSGFANGETVAIALNGNSTGNATATASGTITSVATIPYTANSAHFVFSGGTSGASASVDVGLSGFSPQLTPSTWYAAAGSQITFSGSGFAPGETVTENFNSATQSFTASSDGTVSTTPISIPFSATVAHVAFTSSITHISSSFDIGVAALSPSIWLSTYYDQGGKPLTVFGGGFGGNETVHVAFGGSLLGDTTTDAAGNFTLTSTVPFAAAGNKTIVAHGAISGADASANFTEPQVYTNIQLGSYAGAPGDAVTFIGSGYLPNEPITITTDRTSGTQYTFSADATGSFNNSTWHIPASLNGGPLTITVFGTQSFSSQSIVYYVTGP